jgi:hypothetical protein
MSILSSTAANLPLPGWAYVPGETAEAAADHDTLWQAKALVPSRFRDFVPARHPALRYGIALNDAGYFWEAQEVLEAVWAAAPQRGRERVLLRACIGIANANLKLRMQSPMRLRGSSARHWESLARSAHARRPRPATGLRTVSRRPRSLPCSRPNWRRARCPRPIGSRSAPLSGHEAKCTGS